MLRVREVLRGFEVALGSSNRRRVDTQDSSHDHTLDLVEQAISDFLRGLLQDLGDHPREGASVENLITEASVSVGQHKERFRKEAPVGFFAKRITGLEQVLRDIGYLREGLGSGSGRPQPADMKWSHRGAIESHVVSLMSYLCEELKNGAEVLETMTPEVDIDLGATYRGIVDLLDQTLAAREFMNAAVDLGEQQSQVAGWDVFRGLAYEDELTRRSTFFLEVVEKEPPSKPLNGFGVEIAYPSRQGETIADLWLMGGSAYEPNDESWLDVQEYSPRDHAAHSEVLAEIYRLAYAPGGLGNAADYTLCLAWGAYFSRACARRYLEATGLDRIGLRVGFGGGDSIELGWVQAEPS